MTNSIDSIRLLSSVAVLRSLAENSIDIYQVLFRFIKEAVELSSQTNYKLSELKHLLKKDYGFDKIPESVICKSLSLNNSDGVFSIKNGRYCFKVNNKQKNCSELDNNETRYQRLIDTLFEFVSKKDRPNRTNLENEFLTFLYKNNTDSSYALVISEFIESLKENDDLMRDLNNVREGMILYQGLTWNGDGRLKEWKKQLNLILSTEFLYYLSGCTGPSKKSWAIDMLNLVEYINNVNSGIINLKVLPHSKEEISSFFSKGIKYIQAYPTSVELDSAMKFLLADCRKQSDIVDCAARLKEYCNSYNIQELDSFDEIEIDATNSLFTKELDEELYEKETDCNKRYDYFDILSKIKHLRNGNKSREINKCGFIFVSHSRIARHISKAASDSSCQLSISLAEITNYLWSSCGFMFRQDDKLLPSSFSIYNKASTIITKLGVDKIIDNLHELKEETKKEPDDLIKEKISIYQGMLDKAKKREENKATDDENKEFFDFVENPDEYVDSLILARINQNERHEYQKQVPEIILAKFDRFERHMLLRLNNYLKKHMRILSTKSKKSCVYLILILLDILFFEKFNDVITKFLNISEGWLMKINLLIISGLILFIRKFICQIYRCIYWKVYIIRFKKKKENRKNEYIISKQKKYLTSSRL